MNIRSACWRWTPRLARPGLAVVLTALSHAAAAVDCQSVATGNWNTAGTWTNCRGSVPIAGDVVIINSAHTVTLNTNPPSLSRLTNGGTLRDNAANRTLTLAGDLVNTGTLSLSSTTIEIAGVATWSGEGTWNLGGLDFDWQNHDVALAAGSTLTLNLYDSTPINRLGGSAYFNAGGANTTATVNFARSGGQTIRTTRIVYPNLSLSGSGTKSNDGELDVRGNLTIGSGTTLDQDDDIDLYGNFTNSGTFSYSWDTFTFRGTSAQSVTGATSFRRLHINNASGVTLNSDITVLQDGTLTLSSGNIVTGSNSFIAAGPCSSFTLNRTSGYIQGNTTFTFPGWSVSCLYPVGDSIGYSPVTIAKTGANSGTLTARVDAGDHPDGAAYTGIDTNKSANHYWTLTAGTLSGSTPYSATFRFCATNTCSVPVERDTGATTGNFIVMQKYDNWTTTTTGTRTAYSTQATGLSSFGEFSVGEAGTVLCFADTFSRSDGSAGSSWAVGSQYGSYTPAIVGNRMRLTDAGGSEGTWATLGRTFPAAGNTITLEFDHYAYGGSGADGIAMILSNGSVAPVVGAFGGSLGYAPKSNPGSDCTTSGGCPGFTGGWLGVAIDEYGNFQNPTEGRSGGPGQVPDSVSLRGSGSGMSGYRYLTGSTTLSPGIDGSFSPAHRYRVTVDHSDGTHAYVTVDRDTTSGAGTSYVNVIPRFDAKDVAYSQDAVPSNWQLSFTGSSGGATNIHEIDSLNICTTQGLVVPTLDHIRIEHGGTACTGSSDPAEIVIKACADAACSSLYLDSVTVDLNWGSWSSDPVTFSGGQATVTLTQNWAGNYTLGGSATSPSAANATKCYNGTTQTCTLNFASCYFDAVETGQAAFTPIYTKLAGGEFELDVKNLSNTPQTVTNVEIVDAGAGTACSNYTTLAAGTIASTPPPAAPWSFSGSQTRPFAFNYANAASNARIRITRVQWGQNYYYCSSDNFAIRPARFVLTSTASNAGATGTPTLRAGSDAFSVTATAATSGGAATTLYAGTPAFDLTTGAVGGTTTAGALGAAVFGAVSNGVATASGLSYSEAGSLVLAQGAVNDSSFAAVDSNKGDCTTGFSNELVNGRYGCTVASDAANFGRFIPHHFSTTLTHGCGSFTYSGQPFGYDTSAPKAVVTAYSGGGTVTKNYQGAYAREVALTDGGAASVPCTANCTVANAKFTEGKATLVAAEQPTFAFAAKLTAPATLALRATESAGGDGVTSNVTGGSEGTTEMRSGRLHLSNTFGSEKSNREMLAQTQYWSGNSWVLNSADGCTSVPVGAFALTRNLSGGTTNASSLAIAGGNGIVTFSAPGKGNVGSVDVAANLGTDVTDASCLPTPPARPVTTGAGLPWLRSRNGNCTASNDFVADPSARVTFGVYSPESRRTVDVREGF